MEPRSGIRNIVGLLALGVSLALASPGVNAVQAEPEQPPANAAAAYAGECSEPVPASAAPVQQDPDAIVQQHHREQASRFRDLSSRLDGEVQVLNASGYNYAPAPGTAPRPAQREVAPR